MLDIIEILNYMFGFIFFTVKLTSVAIVVFDDAAAAAVESLFIEEENR